MFAYFAPSGLYCSAFFSKFRQEKPPAQLDQKRRCFKLNSFSSLDKKNTLVVEFKTRYGYIEDPQTGKFEKQEYTEHTEVEFPNHETAVVFRDEWENIWQDYLDEQS